MNTVKFIQYFGMVLWSKNSLCLVAGSFETSYLIKLLTGEGFVRNNILAFQSVFYQSIAKRNLKMTNETRYFHVNQNKLQQLFPNINVYLCSLVIYTALSHREHLVKWSEAYQNANKDNFVCKVIALLKYLIPFRLKDKLFLRF